MATGSEKIENIVKAVLRETFTDIVVERVEVSRDKDEDGDDILLVTVVFGGPDKQLDARKASGVVRHLRPKIAAEGEDAFPVISFVARSDIRNIGPEAA